MSIFLDIQFLPGQPLMFFDRRTLAPIPADQVGQGRQHNSFRRLPPAAAAAPSLPVASYESDMDIDPGDMPRRPGDLANLWRRRDIEFNHAPPIPLPPFDESDPPLLSAPVCQVVDVIISTCLPAGTSASSPIQLKHLHVPGLHPSQSLSHCHDVSC
jgi:hypothetical protein